MKQQSLQNQNSCRWEQCLCTGCGICTAVCFSQCISMQKTSGGILHAVHDNERCSGCLHCRQVCGGEFLHPKAFLPEEDPFTVRPLACYSAHAVDPTTRSRGQSGGAVTALLASLLQDGVIHGAIATFMPADGSLRPYAKLVRSAEDLHKSQGSKYLSVSLGEMLHELSSHHDLRVAVVGLPCHLHSVFNLQHTDIVPWSESIVLKIGLSCDRILSDHAVTYLLNRAAIAPLTCRQYVFRDKMASGWPGEGTAVLNDGSQKRIPNDWRIRCKDAFTPLRCRFCFDKLNFTADILAADPWGVSNDRQGHTVLAARTEIGLKAIGHALDHVKIHAVPVDWEKILAGQRIEEKRSSWHEFMQIQRELQQPVPKYPVKLFEKNIELKHPTDHHRALKLLERSREITQCQDDSSLLETVEFFLAKNITLPQTHRQCKHDPIFGIAGIWLPNRGSELMLYAVMFHLKHKYPRARIVPCFDISHENRCRFGLADPELVSRNIDCVLDASGFFLGDQWRGHLSRSLDRRWKYRKHANEYILLPQAFGPFDNEQVAMQSRDFLHAMSLICSRDDSSFEHVETLCSPSVPHFRFPDFTCLIDGIVPSGRENRCDDGVILLPNIKMLEMGTEEEGKQYLQFMNHVIVRLREISCPHAILCQQESDIAVIRMLEQHTDTILCISESCSLRIKGILGTAKLVVGSRYHGLISAMNQGVPCIGTTWNHKYRTLFDEFGCSEFLQDDLTDFEKLDEVIDCLLSPDQNAKWSKKLKKRAAALRDLSRRMWKVIDCFITHKLKKSNVKSSRHDM